MNESSMNENEFELNAFSLAFKSPSVEGEFLQEVAQRRWPVLIWVFAFDVFCFSLRFVAKLTTSADECECCGCLLMCQHSVPAHLHLCPCCMAHSWPHGHAMACFCLHCGTATARLQRCLLVLVLPRPMADHWCSMKFQT